MQLPDNIEDFAKLAMNNDRGLKFSLTEVEYSELEEIGSADGYDVQGGWATHGVMCEDTLLYTISTYIMIKYPDSIHGKIPPRSFTPKIEVPESSPIYTSWQKAEKDNANVLKDPVAMFMRPPNHRIDARTLYSLCQEPALDQGEMEHA